MVVYLPTSLRNCDTVSVSSFLETGRFTETEIIAAINKLKPNLSPGPDGLPSLLFKKLKYILSYPLSLIFSERHVHVRYMPSPFRLSVVCLSVICRL